MPHRRRTVRCNWTTREVQRILDSCRVSSDYLRGDGVQASLLETLNVERRATGRKEVELGQIRTRINVTRSILRHGLVPEE